MQSKKYFREEKNDKKTRCIENKNEEEERKTFRFLGKDYILEDLEKEIFSRSFPRPSTTPTSGQKEPE